MLKGSHSGQAIRNKQAGPCPRTPKESSSGRLSWMPGMRELSGSFPSGCNAKWFDRPHA